MLSPQSIRNAVHDNQAATCLLLCERWLVDHPDDLDVIDDYATMLYKMTRYEEAISVYLDAAERFPDHRWAIFNQLGQLNRYRGAFSEAESWYRRAIDEDPDEAASYIFLGAVQARQGKLLDAERTHRLAIECPDGMIDEAHHNLGLVLRGQGRLIEAAESFERAIAIDRERGREYAEAIEALRDVRAAIDLRS